MKTITAFVAALLCAAALSAQAPAGGERSWNSMNYGHYRIEFTAGPAGSGIRLDKAALAAMELELLFEYYNLLFRFDPSWLSSPLKVRYFSDKDEYAAYIGSQLAGGAALETAANVNSGEAPAPENTGVSNESGAASNEGGAEAASSEKAAGAFTEIITLPAAAPEESALELSDLPAPIPGEKPPAEITASGKASEAGAVYLHYDETGNRELVILEGAEKEIPFQAFVQFLRAFIPAPPSWMREGFAVYYKDLRFNAETNAVEYRENTGWVQAVKEASAGGKAGGASGAVLGPAVIEATLLSDAKEAEETPVPFQARAWALTAFLLSDKESVYYRSLTDALMLLRPEASAAENGKAVYDRLSLFSGPKNFQADYNAYIAGRKTFNDLIGDGKKAWDAQDYGTAEQIWANAAAQRPERWEPSYCLGLVAYNQKDFTAAENRYTEALKRNEDNPGTGLVVGLIQYARGVNAAAAGKKEEALRFLAEASESGGSYAALARELGAKLK